MSVPKIFVYNGVRYEGRQDFVKGIEALVAKCEVKTLPLKPAKVETPTTLPPKAKEVEPKKKMKKPMFGSKK